jgi:transcriptional regulator CtsR
MGISDIIAGFIGEILTASDGCAEVRRVELASRFNCVPSQINYVIATRFSPERGYIVESRRGGGGYIRITRVTPDPERLVMHTVNMLGECIDAKAAEALTANLVQSEAITQCAGRLILAAIGNNSLREAEPELRGRLRAAIMKQMLINII